jgi:hypothetical protein
MSFRFTLAALTLLLVVPAGAQQADQALPERYTAVAIGLGGIATPPVATRVDIQINRWTTPDEAARLMSVLKDEGPERLLDVLRNIQPVGTIRTPGELAYDLRYAQQEPGEDGGRRIVLATDRPISWREAVERPRTIDYPFTFIELRLDDRGEGEGKLSLATRVEVSRRGRVIELVNYEAQPIHLNEVRRQP